MPAGPPIEEDVFSEDDKAMTEIVGVVSRWKPGDRTMYPRVSIVSLKQLLLMLQRQDQCISIRDLKIDHLEKEVAIVSRNRESLLTFISVVLALGVLFTITGLCVGYYVGNQKWLAPIVHSASGLQTSTCTSSGVSEPPH